jgi:hypothetical protein
MGKRLTKQQKEDYERMKRGETVIKTGPPLIISTWSDWKKKR